MTENTDFIKELRDRLTTLERERDQFEVTAQTSFARRMGEYDGRIIELRQFLLVLDDEDEDSEELVEPVDADGDGG